MSTVSQKAELRRAMIMARRPLAGSERARLSSALCALLLAQSAWRQAGAVLLFAPMPDELDIWSLATAALAAGKRLGFPCYERVGDAYRPREVRNLETDLGEGWYGIREPRTSCPVLGLNPLDLILVPGVAFDRHGRRLGRGKGYYDRMLRGLPGTKCGVAFDEQVVPAVPVAPHDIYLNCIVTPTRWLESEPSVLE